MNRDVLAIFKSDQILDTCFCRLASLQNYSAVLTSRLVAEATKYGDLVALELPLPDFYSNLALKILSILHWTTTRCKLASERNDTTGLEYLVKADQDTFWNVAALRRLLPFALPFSDIPMLLGNVQRSASVARDALNPWRTDETEFAAPTYPTYVTGGAGYVLNAAVPSRLLRAAEGRRIFWLEVSPLLSMLGCMTATLSCLAI